MKTGNWCLWAFIWTCGLIGCDNHTNQPLSYEVVEIKRKAGDCADEASACARVSIQYPEFEEQSGVFVDSINAFVRDHIRELLYMGDNETSYSLYSVEALADSFLVNYDNLLTEMPGYTTGWSNELKMRVLHQDPRYLTLSLEQYIYTGGAHPNSYTALFNLDKQTGKNVQMDRWVQDSTALLKEVERAFRETRGLNKHEDLTEAGFFWGKGFSLPENIGLTEDSVVFYYNSYEIAPYVLGPTEVKIARSQLTGKLMPN